MPNIIREIADSAAALAKGFTVTFKNLLGPTVTENYPAEPVHFEDRYRGIHILRRDENGLEKCVACFLCAAVYAIIFDAAPRFMLKPAIGPGDASLRNQLIFAFFAAPGLLHYWIDGHIWKVRSDPELRAYLQLDRL